MLPIDEVKTKIIDAKDKLHLKRLNQERDIRKSKGWIPNHKGPVCVGCRHADVNVISVMRYDRETNELSIYCRKKFRIITKPYEQCAIRDQRPNVVLTSFLERF